MLKDSQVSSLYNNSREELAKSGIIKSCVTVWNHNVTTQWAYKLALEILGVKSCPDRDIWNAILSEEGYNAIEAVALNEFYFWRIVNSASLSFVSDKPKIYTVKRAISEIRSNMTRYPLGRMDVVASLINDNLSAYDAVRLNSIGLLLWNRTTESIALNPLYFAEDEWDKLKIKQAIVLSENL